MCEHDLTAVPVLGGDVSRRRVLAGGALLGLAWPWSRRAHGWRRGPSATDGVEVVPGLRIMPRDSWGADLPPLAEPRSEDVRFLLVHHSGAPSSPTNGRQQIRSVYGFHTGPEKRWPDVCYQFFIDPSGTVWEGRAGSLDGPTVADATGGSQGFAQLVCLLGDFNTALPSTAAMDSLRSLLAWLAERSGLDTSPGATATFVSRGSQRWSAGTSVTTPTINGHRSMSYTDCPGDALWPYVADGLQADVHARRAAMRPFDPPIDPNGLVPARRGARRTVRH